MTDTRTEMETRIRAQLSLRTQGKLYCKHNKESPCKDCMSGITGNVSGIRGDVSDIIAILKKVSK